jgi:hypothetical protein
MDLDHHGTAVAEGLATGTATSGYVPISTGVGAAPAWGPQTGGGGGGGAMVDLVTGNDSTFAASLGAWTNSGGTMTRDTSNRMRDGTASLKLACTGSGQYADLVVSGTFSADTDYWAVFWVSNESTTGSKALALNFGLVGTDETIYTATMPTLSTLPYVGNARYVAIALNWRPTANRTGVSIRLTNNDGSTTNWHVGMARVFAGPIDGPLTVYGHEYTPADLTQSAAQISPWGDSTGIRVTTKGDILLDNNDLTSGVQVNRTAVNGVYYYAEHTPSSVPSAGHRVEVGTGYLGYYFSQKDSTTCQFYPNTSGGLDIELLDRNATKVWRSVSSGGISKPLNKMENRVSSGTATITSGNTAITVTHGAGYTPSANDIVVTPTNNPTNDPGNFWIDTIGSTTFAINVRANPGTSGAIFAWRVDR